MVEGIFSKEDEEDFRSCTEQSQLWSFDPIEVEARRVYTRKIYSIFKNLFRQSTKYNTHEIEKDALYEIKRIHDPVTDAKTWSYWVQVDKANNEVSCNCQGFEFQGLLCSHSLKVMQNLGMHLHARYILSRWTKEANQGVKRYYEDMRSVEVLWSDAERFDDLQKKAMKIVHAFWKPSKLCNIASRKLEACYNEIDKIAQNMRYNISTEDVSVSVIANNILIEGGETNKEMIFRDPPQSQCKGKRKPERFKHPVEKKMRTSRKSGAQC